MDLELIHVQMANNIMANGKMVKEMVLEYNVGQIKVAMMENGEMIYKMDMVYIFFIMDLINIQENGRMVVNTD